MHVTIVLGTSYATMRSVAFEFRGAAQRYAEGFIAERSVAAARLVLAVTLLAMPAIARAGSETIALDDALRIAIARNPGLIATRVDAEIASDRVRSAKGAQDWVLSSDATFNMTPANLAPAEPATKSVTTTSALTRPLPGGGSIGLSAQTSFARETIVLDDTRAKIDDDVASVSLVLRQPLLRGWGGDTSPQAQIARTEATHNIARLEATAAAAQTIRDVVRAYWEVGFARDDLAIRRASLALAKEQLRITRARVDSGRIAASETLAVGQAIAVREDEVAQSEATLAVRSLELARLLGREVASPLVFDPSDRPATAPRREIDREIAAALARSPDIATVRARGAAASIEVDVAENAMMPALDFSASGGVRGEAPTSREVRRQLEKGSNRIATAELVLTIPLGNRAASGALAAAQRGVRRVKLDEKALVVETRRAIVEAITTMESARHRIAVLDQAVHLADQAIDAERARWEEGKSTNYDVMKRQAEREDSALRRARAQADLVEAEAALDALTGAILPRYRVGLAP